MNMEISIIGFSKKFRISLLQIFHILLCKKIEISKKLT